jgi:hypothetical protein
MFKTYLEEDQVPLFKGKKCYFSTPFVATFQEKQNYYYIVNERENGYFVCVYDEDQATCMSGGCMVDDEPQADEHLFDTFIEVEKFLSAYHFSDDDILRLKIKLDKLKEGVANGK